MADQNWTPVVLRKELKSAPKTASGLAAAKSKGQVDTVKKDHVTNQKPHGAGVNGVRLDDNEVADFKHATVTHDFKLALQQARQNKGWSQKDLAGKLNVQPSVIASYENGKAIPQPVRNNTTQLQPTSNSHPFTHTQQAISDPTHMGRLPYSPSSFLPAHFILLPISF